MLDERLHCERFPRASAYHPEWLIASASGAANPLWMTEWLAEALDLRPGARVLDLALGYVRVVGRRKAGVQLAEPVVSVPTQYAKKPLLRGGE